MEIAYVANIRLPTERAHGVQIMNTCAALAATGTKVRLYVPRRRNPIATDPFDFYGLPRTFEIVRLPGAGFLPLSASWIGRIAFAIQTFVFACSMACALKRREVIYGRDEAVLASLSLLSKSVFWETHTGSDNVFSRMLQRRAKGIVCITRGLSGFYAGKGVSQGRLLVAPDAVDLRKFESVSDDKDLHRSALGLPREATVFTYSGSIAQYAWKGVDTFLDSMAHLADRRARFLVVGGKPGEVQGTKDRYRDERLVMVGQVPAGDVVRYLKASDVLVLPNKAGDKVSERFTSPMKMFEYMASGRPIVASDLPSIREVLDRECAELVPAGDPESLALALEKVSEHESWSETLASRALAKVREYTWEARARSVLEFIGNKI